MKVLVLNGPNLDRLGERQTELYGTTTLAELIVDLRERASEAGAELEALQSADPDVLIQAIRTTDADAIIINPASLTHHDRRVAEAIATYPGMVVEVHISNIHRREPYRRRSLIAPVATGSIIGLGVDGYSLALDAILKSAQL